MKRTLLGLLLALLLLGCGGGEANMAVTVTRIDPNPDCPFPDADDGNRAHDLAWDPTGTYLSVGGWNSAGDKLFAWYKWDGSSLTELTPPSSAPTAVVGQAWDPTSTYLAIGVGEWYSYNLPCDNSLLLYKRTGDTLALVDTYTPPYDRNIGRVRWLPDSGDGNTYLLVSSGNDYYGPWGAVDGSGTAGVGTHSLALFQRTGDSIAFDTSYEVDTNYGFGVGFDLAVHPSGDYVAWSMEAYTFDDYDAGRTWVFSWDGAGTLTKVAGPYKIGGYPWQIDIAWNPAGTHLAQANSDGTYDYSGVVLWKWDGGAETLTKLTLADMEIDPPGLDDFEAYDVNWHPTEPYLLATGVNGGAADYMTRLYKLVGDDFEYQAHELDEDIYAQGYAGVWHPDGTMFAQASEGSGNYLYLYEVTGIITGLTLGNVQKLLPLMNRVGSWRAQDFINTLTPFAHDPADTWEVANITDNPWWRAMAGYGNGSDGQDLVVENDIAYFIPAALPGAGARLNQGWFLHSTTPTDGAGRGFMNFTDSYFVVKPQLPTHDGVVLSTTEFTMKPTWVGDTGKGSESVAASFLAEIAGYVGTYTFSFEYWDEAGAKQVDVSDSDTFVYDPSTMAFFRWRHDSDSHTFYLEAASRCGGGGWSVIAALDLTQAVPMWGFMFDWYVDFDSDAAEEPPTPFAITFNPQPNSYRSVGCELWNIVDPVPRPGTMFATMPLLNTVAG